MSYLMEVFKAGHSNEVGEEDSGSGMGLGQGEGVPRSEQLQCKG